MVGQCAVNQLKDPQNKPSCLPQIAETHMIIFFYHPSRCSKQIVIVWLLSSHINFVIAYTHFAALAHKSTLVSVCFIFIFCDALMLLTRFRQANTLSMQTVPLWPSQLMTTCIYMFGFVCIINCAIILLLLGCVFVFVFRSISTLVPIFIHNLISTSCSFCRTNYQRQINIDVVKQVFLQHRWNMISILAYRNWNTINI